MGRQKEEEGQMEVKFAGGLHAGQGSKNAAPPGKRTGKGVHNGGRKKDDEQPRKIHRKSSRGIKKKMMVTREEST